MLERYVDQVRLLIDLLPHIAKEEEFALKAVQRLICFTVICHACPSIST